ncbi:MAG: helix-turn-helix domain-containing protein [Thermoleophilaceae bacterium]
MPAPAASRTRQPRMPIEARREQVLDAALRLISRHGYGAATMEAIAREADLSKPVVYNAYRDRAALLQALLEREEARAFKALAEALPPQPADADATMSMLSWLRTLAHAIAEDPVPWRLMLVPGPETPESVLDHVEAGRAFALEQVGSLIRALLDERPALERVDRELASQAVLAMAEHSARLLIADPETYTPERLAEFGEALLTSVLPRPSNG